MKRSYCITSLILVASLVGAAAVYSFRGSGPPDATQAPEGAPEAAGESETLPHTFIVGDQAQKNLRLTAKPLQSQDFWKTIAIQGMVVDRPGVSDREIVAPAAGMVGEIHHVPGDAVQSGDTLFAIKLASPLMHETQTELFKTTQNIDLANSRLTRLKEAGAGIAQVRLIEVEHEIARLQTAENAYRQQLLSHGLSNNQIDGVRYGRFVNEVVVRVPQRKSEQGQLAAESGFSPVASSPHLAPRKFEVQELAVELGEQVQMGQTLCRLADHQRLAIEGKAFRDEIPLLEHSIQEQWPVEVDFQENTIADWPPLEQAFHIRYLTNTIDPNTRTFAFQMPLENQSKMIDQGDRKQVFWRFRPGQKLRLRVRVEKLPNVFVLPADAAVLEGAEAYLFTQNVNTFERKSVHVLFRDREQVVIANDGTLATYTKDQRQSTIAAVVRTAAAQLNRMSKAGAGSSDVPKGYHIHADGSLHKNEDEGK